MMSKIIVASILLTLVLVEAAHLPAIDRAMAKNASHFIVGVTDAKAGDNPWQCSMRYLRCHICGVTIINEQWPVTPAHRTYGSFYIAFTINIIFFNYFMTLS